MNHHIGKVEYKCEFSVLQPSANHYIILSANSHVSLLVAQCAVAMEDNSSGRHNCR